jgi:hypothetical protein
MQKQLVCVVLLHFITLLATSQDSVWARLRPKYNEVSGLHRVFFGNNYRAEWSDSTYLPLIDLAQVDGGLKPLRLGGGHQTISLRLVASSGREWVLRNIEKDPSVLLPAEIRQTFARDIVDDAMSAQHPFSPLVVSVLAEATGVPHANPVIGVIKESSALGEYNGQFANKVCLLEEREPLGDSENSPKMFEDLNKDNDNAVDGEAFLKARLLDLFIGDWDRHPDQWRWVDTRKGRSKYYVGIPRDRDQAFYVNQGFFPRLASRPWFVPSLQGFRGDIWFPKYSLKESSFMHSRMAMHMPYERWMQITHTFTSALTDEVLENALRKLPAAAYQRRHDELFRALKERRDNIPAAMHEYYHFVNRIAELRLSDKHEFVHIHQAGGDTLQVDIFKLSKNAVKDTVFSNAYYPSTTRELRIYTGAGNDSVAINAPSARNRIRVIGGTGNKSLHVAAANKKVHFYNNDHNYGRFGNPVSVREHISADSANTAYSAPNRYNVAKPLVTAGFNRDDGFLLGLGLQYTHQGFRKFPYAGLNRIMLHRSFATSAYRIRYSGEFIHVIGKTDLVTQVDVYAPQNTQNFFGTGNESFMIKGRKQINFYRTRFSLYNLSAGFRWRTGKGWNFVAAPAFQHYRYDSSDNRNRILEFPGYVHSYDSFSLGKNKSHLGMMVNIGLHRANSVIIPSSGFYLNLKLQGLGALNDHAKGYGQVLPEFVGFVPLNKKRTMVFAERIGGGISLGRPAFYQSMFAGGHENLLGYRQYRFAGEHMLYNNMELRLKLANFTGYVIPGEFGMLGFYDIGRVWVKNEDSKTWHQGTGGGLYFAPAKMAVISLVAGYSEEGWYPYITFGFRY